MSPDINTDHDHYLTCAFTRLSKTKRITSITVKLDKLHTPRFLRDTIIHVINEYYNNDLVDDLPKNYPIPFNHKEIIKCTHLQDRIKKGHFLRGRISTSFHSPPNSYFRSNYLSKRYTSHLWFRCLVPFLWDLYHNLWLDNCNQIHFPDTNIHKILTAKSTLLHLVAKYILEAKILPKHKRLFFACKKSKYQSWNITNLQNRLSSARRILRKY